MKMMRLEESQRAANTLIILTAVKASGKREGGTGCACGRGAQLKILPGPMA